MISEEGPDVLDGMPVKAEFKGEANFTESATIFSDGFCKGAGKLLKAAIGKRLADVDFYQKVTAAKAELACKMLVAGEADIIDGSIVPVDNANKNSISILNQIQAEEEGENVIENLKVAFAELGDTPDEEISDQDLDPDFFSRWRREAGVIGHQELQGIWGRLLAEEVKRPESVSYRCLEVVKNLSRSEALLFQSIARFVVYGNFLPCKSTGDENFLDVLKMLDCGLVTTMPGKIQSTSTTVLNEQNPLFFMPLKDHVLINHTEGGKVAISGSSLSQPAQELYKIMNVDEMQPNDYPHLFECLMNKAGVKLHPLRGDRYFIDEVLYE